MRPASEFTDYYGWIELYNLHLGRYPMPELTETCTSQSMDSWIDRLGQTETYGKSHGKTEDFIALNDWPLFAWLGLCLEDKHEASVKN